MQGLFWRFSLGNRKSGDILQNEPIEIVDAKPTEDIIGVVPALLRDVPQGIPKS